MKNLDQRGVIPILILISALGVLGFIFISSSATFKDKLFSQIFPKRSSYAVSEPISPSPTPSSSYQRVFITSTTYRGDGFGGLSGADAKCQDRASIVNLGGAWKAWISDSNISASSRLEHSNVPYKLLNGIVIADSWSDLTTVKPDGSYIRHAINITELGTEFNPLVWTNTQPTGGIVATNTINNCVNWTQSYGGLTAYVGAPGINDFLGQKWTSYVSQECGKEAALYCFEQTAPTPTPIPDVTAPKVRIGNPGNNTYVKGGNITFAASASDNVAVSKVEFYVDGVLLSTDTESPYRASWDTTALANGSVHTLTAKAYDTSNNYSKSSVSVTIDKVPPTVSVTNPVNGSVVGVNTTVTISATAADDVGIKQVNFRVNNTLLCNDKTSPYSCDWTVPATAGVSYTISAVAVDKAGNTAKSTVKVTSK